MEWVLLQDPVDEFLVMDVLYMTVEVGFGGELLSTFRA